MEPCDCLRVFFETTNAAFEIDPAVEASRILREIAFKLDNGYTEGSIRDSNGNTVGSWGFGHVSD